MKYIKSLGLAGVVAGVLMAFAGAGTASATELTCGSSLCAAGTTFHFQSEGKTVLDAPFGNIECEWTVHGHITSSGFLGIIPKIKFTEVFWHSCGNDNVVTLAPGELEIHTFETSANGDGTVTWVGAEWTVEHVGTHCIFGTKTGTDIGRLTGSTSTGGTPTLDISATIPRIGGRSGVFCGSSAPWTGSFSIDAPDSLSVD